MVSYIQKDAGKCTKRLVLILIVVDDGIVLLFYVLIEYKFIVLILVVVDDGLVLLDIEYDAYWASWS